MKKAKKVLACFSTLLCIGALIVPVHVSAAKANGKNYLGDYAVGDNVNSFLTLRDSVELTPTPECGYYAILKKDNIYFTVNKIYGNSVGYVSNVGCHFRSSSRGYLKTEYKSGYVNLDYCKENYTATGGREYIIPDGTNNVDGWNEEYVTLWGAGCRVYANNYSGNLGSNYRLGKNDAIFVKENGTKTGTATVNNKTGTVYLNYLLPKRMNNNDRNAIKR